MSFSRAYLENLREALRHVPVQEMARAMAELERAYLGEHSVFLAGNGGSAATASHMANDLLKGVAQATGKGLRAIALTDNVPVITAIANDQDYSEIFAAQLAILGREGDVLLVISGSGNSPNILRALEVARQKRMTSVAFLGMGGGKALPMADIAIVAPSDDYGPIEILHMVFDHMAVSYFKSRVREARG